MREVHDVIAGLLGAAQEAGRIPADRDVDAEAWIFIGGGLLISVADRLGGVLRRATSTGSRAAPALAARKERQRGFEGRARGGRAPAGGTSGSPDPSTGRFADRASRGAIRAARSRSLDSSMDRPRLRLRGLIR